jgi:hypothetical protein
MLNHILKIRTLSIAMIIVSIALLHTATYAAGNKSEADFLIIEDPTVYSFLNEFEQPVSESEKNSFIPYSPFQIVSLGEQLGDQITNAAHFVFNGKSCFILTDEKFQRTRKKATWEKTFRKCQIINDTVTVNRPVTLSVKEPGSTRKLTLQKGASLKRVFKSNGLWYCSAISSRGEFGWFQGGTESFDIASKKSSVQTLSYSLTEISDRIKSRLDNANAQYDTFFTYFNKKTSQNRSIPSWGMQIDGNSISCILKGPSQIDKYLEKSTHYIISDIEHILLGKLFQTSYNKGEIIIRPRMP